VRPASCAARAGERTSLGALGRSLSATRRAVPRHAVRGSCGGGAGCGGCVSLSRPRRGSGQHPRARQPQVRFRFAARHPRARGPEARGAAPDCEVLLLDTLGELLAFDAAADIAYVGGSLAPVGGHNLLEPAALGLPILTGPYNTSSEEIAQLLIARGAAEVV